MGYSISVRFPNQSERDAMHLFLLDQDLCGLTALEPNSPATLVRGEEMAYAPKGKPGHLLGFNGRIIPFSAWAVCAWMAQKSTVRVNGTAGLFYDEQRYAVLPPPDHSNGEYTVLVDKDDVMIVREKPSLARKALEAFGMTRRAYPDAQEWVRSLNGKWDLHMNNLPDQSRTPKRLSP